MENASSTQEPLNSEPSFAIRGPPSKNFLRSVSNKEPQFTEPPCIPPRLSTTSLSLKPFFSPPASPPRHHLSSTTPSRLHELHTNYKCISSILKKDGQILSIASSNGLVYTGSQGNVIRIWKLPEFAECGQLKTKACMAVALEVSNDRIYAAYADCKIRVWRRSWDGNIKHVRIATIPNTGSYVRSYIARGKDKMMKHMGPISSLAINVSYDILYSASLDRTVKVWRLSDLKCIETIQGHPEPINDIVVADDGVLYTASDDAAVRVWRRNFCNGDHPHSLTVTLPAKSSPIKTLALTVDGGVLYGGCTDGYVQYWLKGWLSGQLQYGGALPGHTHAVMCLASVVNYVVSGSADGTSRIWIREQDGRHACIGVLQGHRGPIRCVAAFLERVSEDTEEGCTVCTASLDGVLKVWRVRSTSQIRDST
ncbi:protein JINGUBANG-like [Olea europaea var. sylvestris]|uniref:protein JINGUBANG-like n=1 Tax=Olea europaea var. sylvestris TaxID=158386 RepID=UPI000C1D4239|nr:protein JINGUBANG-like [Olea europaea var. sylvestris]